MELQLRYTGLLAVVAFFLVGGAGAPAWGQSGPGGVEATDGASNLKLWLEADEDVTTSLGSVSAWGDQSGYGNVADQSTGAAQPELKASVVNGKPIVRFDGTNDILTGTSLLAGGTTGRTVVTLARPNINTENLKLVSLGLSPVGKGGVYTTTPEIYVRTGGNKQFQETQPTNRFSVVTTRNAPNSQIKDIEGFLNGSAMTGGGSDSGGKTIDVQGNDFGIGGFDGQYFLDGDVAETIVFDKALNEAERIAVENYLASKYGLAISGDRYAHDGSYPNDVAGVGQSNGATQTAAYSDVLRITGPQGLRNGDFLFYGHDGAASGRWTTTETPSDNYRRIEREWKFDETGGDGDVGNVTIQVDTGKLPDPPSGYTKYYALISEDNDFSTRGDQSLIELTQASGSIYEATGVNIDDDHHLTYVMGAPAATPENVAAASDLNERTELTFDEVTTNAAGLLTTLTGDEYLVYIDSRDNSGFSFSDATALSRGTDYTISTSGGTVTANVTQDQGEDNGAGTTGIDNGTDYALWVTAKNEVGESGESSQVTATPALKVYFKTASTTGSEKDDANPFEIKLSDTNDQDVSVNLAIAPDGQSPFDGTSLRSVNSIDNIDNGGSGYSVGDIIGENSSDGGSGLQIKVTSVDGSGAVTGADVEVGGSGYTSAPTSFTTVSGGGSGADFSVSLQSSGSDYNLGPTTATVSAGNLTTKIDNGDLTFDDDTTPENTETVELTLSNPSTSNTTATLGSQVTHEVDVNDNDLNRKVYLTDAIGTADDGATSEQENTSVTYTLELNNSDPVNDTKVEWRIDTGAGTAEDSDFSSLSGTETIAAGNSSTTFTLPVAGDSEFEDNETADVILVAAENANLDNSTNSRFTTLTHTITNDDSAPVVSFANTTSSAEEADNTISIAVELDRTSSEDITVDLSKGGTATGGGTDYAFPTSSVTIPAGNTSATLAPDIKDDALDENDETLSITLAAVTSGQAMTGTDDTHTHTIVDNETPPTVAFQNTAASESEDTAGSVQIGLVLSEVSGRSVTVNYTKQGAAAAGSDYTDSSGGEVTFSAGSTSETIDLSIRADRTAEADETIDLSFSSNSVTNGTAGTPTSFTYTIVNDDLGFTGPAGVGGKATNPLWVRADSAVDVTSGSVAEWGDLSGNGNNATASGAAQPNLTTNAINGEPSVSFEGDDVLTGSSSLVEGTSGRTVIALFSPDNNRADGKILSMNYSRPGSADGGVYTLTEEPAIRVGGGNKIYKQNIDRDYNLLTAGNGRGETVGASQTFWDGSELTRTSSSTSTRIDVQGSDFGIGDFNGIDFFSGDIAEIIVYASELNTAQRTIVENYIATRYALGDYTGTDIYAGTFTHQLFGIGQASDGSHPASSKAGLRLDINQGFESGDYVMAGHDVSSNSTTFGTGNLPSGVQARMKRNWELDVTNGGNDAVTDFTFDLSDAGLNGPAGTAGDYELLQRPGTTGGWTSLGTASSVNGDKITFSGIRVNDAYYTIASSDTTNSPIDNDGLALVIDGEPGTGEVDEGWRYLGMPATGASAADLKQSDGTQFINYGYRMAYTWDDANGAWTAITSDEALPAGRGYIVWLFDQTNAYPVDPSITMKLPSSFRATGDTDVTVGDGSPSADAALSTTDNDQHLLSNPYSVPYDLGALGSPGGDSFKDEVQIWEADADAGGNDPSGADDGNVGSYVKRSRTQGEKIAAWQGFWFFRDAAGGNSQVTFGKSGRAAGTAPGFVGSKSQKSTDIRQVNLKVVARNDEGTVVALDKAASVAFASEATEGPDYLDTPKLQPQSSAYTVIGPVGPTGSGTKMKAQESRPVPEDPVEVPLAFDAKDVSGDVTISAADLEGVPSEWTVTLVDTRGTSDPADDTSRVLEQNGAGYTFTYSSNKTGTAKASATENDAEQSDTTAAGPPTASRLNWTSPTAGDSTSAKAAAADAGARFRLRVDPRGQALPVEMAEFTAQSEGTKAVLNWATALERNNAGFYVQHQRLSSADTTAQSGEWTRLGFIEGKKRTGGTYSYKTSTLEYGTHAFRLRQVDNDGTTHDTDTRKLEVRLDKAYSVGQPYPNPVRGRATLEVAVQREQKVKVRVYDVLGRQVATPFRGRVDANTTRKIQVSSRQFASGVYFMRVIGDNFRVTRKMMIVQ